MQDGNILYEGYFNGADKHTLHNTRSVTKTVTGMAVGAAISDGVLNLKMPIHRLFSDIAPFANPDPRKMSITLQDLLTMSGPLECNDNDRYSRGHEERMHNIEDWSSFFWDLPIRGYPGWSEKPESAKYGRVFAYCSAGVEIAGQAVERATNKSFQDYVKARIFDPMNITHYGWQENGLGQAHKSGGLGLRTVALAKLAEMQRNGGVYDGQQVLSDPWTVDSVKPRVVADQRNNIEYGFLWWLADYKVSGKTYKSYYMSGNGGNRVMVMPAHRLVVVITKTDYNRRGMHQATDTFFDQEIYSRLRP